MENVIVKGCFFHAEIEFHSKFKIQLSYHNAVGFPDGPQVDLLVVAARDEDPAGLVAEGQAVDGGSMSNKLL